MFVFEDLHTLKNGECRGVKWQGEAIFIVKHEHKCHVYRNVCPHMGTTLNFMPDQFLDGRGQFLQCNTHGALFEIDSGYCVDGPCQGKNLSKVASEQRDGKLYIHL